MTELSEFRRQRLEQQIERARIRRQADRPQPLRARAAAPAPSAELDPRLLVTPPPRDRLMAGR